MRNAPHFRCEEFNRKQRTRTRAFDATRCDSSRADATRCDATRDRGAIRPRSGRILAECIVSLAVLAVGVTVSLTLSRASLLLADEARVMNELAATAGAQAERATADACSGTNASGEFTAARVRLNWIDALAPDAPQLTRQRHVQADVQFTPLANRDSSAFTIDAAGVCPW